MIVFFLQVFTINLLQYIQLYLQGFDLSFKLTHFFYTPLVRKDDHTNVNIFGVDKSL